MNLFYPSLSSQCPEQGLEHCKERLVMKGMKLSCQTLWRQLAQGRNQDSWLQVTDIEWAWNSSMILSFSLVPNQRQSPCPFCLGLGRKPIACASQNIKSHIQKESGFFRFIYMFQAPAHMQKVSTKVFIYYSFPFHSRDWVKC